MIINNEHFDLNKSTFLLMKVQYTTLYSQSDRTIDNAKEFLNTRSEVIKSQIDKLAEHLLNNKIVII